MISRPRFGCALSASLLLSACGLPGGEPAPGRTEASATVASGLDAVATQVPAIAEPEEVSVAETGGSEFPFGQEAGSGESPSKQKAGGEETAPRLAMKPVKKLAPPDPGRLIGMDRDEVAGLLGPPDFRRRDNPALVWLYRSGACIMDVFLYREGEDYSVAHFEVRGLSVVEVDRNVCFLGLLREREKSG